MCFSLPHSYTHVILCIKQFIFMKIINVALFYRNLCKSAPALEVLPHHQSFPVSSFLAVRQFDGAGGWKVPGVRSRSCLCTRSVQVLIKVINKFTFRGLKRRRTQPNGWECSLLNVFLVPVSNFI